jgi:hypothetical protein
MKCDTYCILVLAELISFIQQECNVVWRHCPAHSMYVGIFLFQSMQNLFKIFEHVFIS